MSSASATPPSRLHDLPSRMITQLAVHVRRVVADGLGEYGTHQYALLAALVEGGPASQATLGRACGIDRSDVVAAIDGLAARGLVRRDLDPAHRRRNVVSLTDEGRRTVTELDQRVADIQREVLAPLSETERAQLTSLMRRLLDHHSAPP